MHYEPPFTGWHVTALAVVGFAIIYFSLYGFVWVLKYFWSIV